MNEILKNGVQIKTLVQSIQSILDHTLYGTDSKVQKLKILHVKNVNTTKIITHQEN